MVWLVGGVMLLASALLFICNLRELHRAAGRRARRAATALCLAVHPPDGVPAALNGFALWNVLVLVLMIAAYG